MNIVLWIVFGILVGTITYVRGSVRSWDNLIGLILLATLGSVLGGFLGNLVFRGGIDQFSVTSLFQAALGSILVVVADRSVSKDREIGL